MNNCRIQSFLAFVFISVCLPFFASSDALITTPSDGNLAVIFPNPETGLPFPVQINVAGLPADATPNAASYFGCHLALVTDYYHPRIFVVDTSAASVLSTIDTTGFYDGRGTIAVSPDGLFALAASNSNNLTVIQAPFNSSSNMSSVQIPGTVAAYQTQAIVFDANNTAYVYHRTGISVLNQPYSSVAFTIPMVNGASGSIAVNPTGDKILVTILDDRTLRIFTAPFSADSVPETLVLSTSDLILLSGINITPDGNTVLVASDWNSPKLFAVSAPFSSASTFEEITMPDLGGTLGFEDVGISPDGQLAILTGNSGQGLKAAFVKAPFTAADATVYAVNVIGPGRGSGAARFLPPKFSIVLSPLTIPDGSYTIPYSQPLTVNGGVSPYTFAVTSGQLPEGITVNPSTGLISGRPTRAGNFSFTITVTDATGCTGKQSYSMNVSFCSGTFFDDFEDNIQSWLAYKPTWSESNGNLIGVSTSRKAFVLAVPPCICLQCTVTANLLSTGGNGNKIWFFSHYKNKGSTLEVVIKSHIGRIILNEKSNGVKLQKVKANYAFEPNIVHSLDVSFDGINIIVSVDGAAIITTKPIGQLEIGTIGFQTKFTTIEVADVSVQ